MVQSNLETGIGLGDFGDNCLEREKLKASVLYGWPVLPYDQDVIAPH